MSEILVLFAIVIYLSFLVYKSKLGFFFTKKVEVRILAFGFELTKSNALMRTESYLKLLLVK